MMHQKSYNKKEQKTAFPGSLSGIPGGSAGRAAASGPLGERSSDFLFSLIPGKAPGSLAERPVAGAFSVSSERRVPMEKGQGLPGGGGAPEAPGL